MCDCLYKIRIGRSVPVPLPLDAEGIVLVVAYGDLEVRQRNLAFEGARGGNADVVIFHGSGSKSQKRNRRSQHTKSNPKFENRNPKNQITNPKKTNHKKKRATAFTDFRRLKWPVTPASPQHGERENHFWHFVPRAAPEYRLALASIAPALQAGRTKATVFSFV